MQKSSEALKVNKVRETSGESAAKEINLAEQWVLSLEQGFLAGCGRPGTVSLWPGTVSTDHTDTCLTVRLSVTTPTKLASCIEL